MLTVSLIFETVDSTKELVLPKFPFDKLNCERERHLLVSVSTIFILLCMYSKGIFLDMESTYRNSHRILVKYNYYYY